VLLVKVMQYLYKYSDNYKDRNQ